MSQKLSSAATSINAARVPKVYGKIRQDLAPRSLVFDYGCGKYTDHIRTALPGVVYLPFDPFNQPDDVNAASLTYLANAMHMRFPVTIVCSNVLNVIDSDDEVDAIASRIKHAVLHTGGTAYITVYAGDRSGVGRKTGPDQWQRNEPLQAYLPLFDCQLAMLHYGKKYRTTAAIERGMIVVRCEEVKK